MGWNMTEIAGKLVGSGLFVWGLTDFIRIMFKYLIQENNQGIFQITTSVVDKTYNQVYPVVPDSYIMGGLLMTIGLTLLFIRYPESK